MTGDATARWRGDHRLPRRNGADAKLRAGTLHQNVVRLERTGRLKDAVRGAADPFDAAGDADESFGLVVVGRQVLVGDRPVPTEPVTRARCEIVVGETECDPAVVVRTATENPGAEPREVTARRHRVGFAVDLRAAKCGAEGEAGAAARVDLPFPAGAAVRNLVRPDMLLQVCHAQHRARFEQEHADAQVGEHFRDRAAAGPGADHDDVVDFGGLGELYQIPTSNSCTLTYPARRSRRTRASSNTESRSHGAASQFPQFSLV